MGQQPSSRSLSQTRSTVWPSGPAVRLARQPVDRRLQAVQSESVVAAGRVVAAFLLEVCYQILQVLAVDKQMNANPATTVLVCSGNKLDVEPVHRATR